ncbi:hypothetical protein NCCP691_23480 [Noviherbaspirillum aridicola]|uniref:Uncharacterized protein n=2 Tax=Noviherbaspirillum aridicola TaxID=2849687 RepID=A0ABQ4Q569_9BURK|nr:hypothetical protein NCCP691_23480 [Noviherbaspirillum aridicola]
MSTESGMNQFDNRRRRLLVAGGLYVSGGVFAGVARAGSSETNAQAPREMQIHKVRELGLEIWVENQPPWRTELQRGAHPTFIAEAPEAHHPPAVMSYSSWPKERVAEGAFATMARTAITRASQNFGLNVAASRALTILPAKHASLSGHEADFVGTVQGVAMDVRIFVGQEKGRFPVVLTLYTRKGKIHHLEQHVRRAWGRLAYL